MCVVQSKQLYTTRVVSRKGRKMKRNGESDSTTSYAKKTLLRRFFHGRNGDKDPLLFYSLYLSQSTLLDLFSSRRRVYGKIVSKQCFFETLFASRRVAFHFRIVTVLLTLLNLYGVYMHGHVLARVSTIRARLGVNIYRVDARISHVRTANWWKLEYRTTGRTRSPRFFLGYREISNFFLSSFSLFFFFRQSVSLKRRAVTDIITPDIYIRGANFARFVSEKKKKLTLKM